MAQLVALDPAHRPPRIAWTMDMRKVLCCWAKFYRPDWRAFQAIFSLVFSRELRECGFADGRLTDYSRLMMQWHEMRRNHDDPILVEVNRSNLEPEPWVPFILKIEEAAASRSLRIFRKSHHAIDTAISTYQNQVSTPPAPMVQIFQDEQAPDNEDPQDPEDYSIVTPQTRTSDEPQQAAGLLCAPGDRTCYWCYLELLEKEQDAARGLDFSEPPRLLYRWWNADSQGVNATSMFVAGLFVDTSTAFFTPDTIAADEFKARFLSHIQIERNASPLISTFKSALAPVHRSLRNQEGASVSIIDTTKLKSKVYSAMEFVREHGIKVGTYNGAGEYLVWGKVERDAIVCTFKITNLLRIAAEHVDIKRLLQLDMIASARRNRFHLHREMAKSAVHLDKRSGMTMGKLLSILEVPEEYCQTVSEGLAYSWRVKTRTKPWGDFFEGVELGYRGLDERIMPFLSSPVTEEHSRGIDMSDDSEDDYHIVESDDDWDMVETKGNSNNECADESEDEDHDDADSVTVESNTVDSPNPRSQPNAKQSVLFLNQISGAQPAYHQESTTDRVDSDVEDLNLAGEELDLFDEMVLQQEQNAADRFASERARVFSTLQ
ncbi:hypothetical protein BJX70DRAFT_398735 [Aspergillus crustosus]